MVLAATRVIAQPGVECETLAQRLWAWGVSPDNDDTLHRVGVKLGLDTRDSWGNPRRGWHAGGGVGVGLRILVPGTEMTRLDVGWSPAGGFQLHFAPWSKPTAQRGRLR